LPPNDANPTLPFVSTGGPQGESRNETGTPRGATPEPDPAPRIPALVDAAGRYRLQGEIARGGVGVVFKGRDTHLGRDVAVKMLHEPLLRHLAILRRFEREARITAQLQHPGVVPVHETGHLPGGRPFFVMKLVTGRTLDRFLADRQGHALQWPHLLKVFEQVCQTLAYAHAHGVIHRDLKPSNVMVGEFGEVYVMDWGLAKVVGANDGTGGRAAAMTAPDVRAPGDGGESTGVASLLTDPGRVMGTLAYMPPEQAGGAIDRLEPRTDVFALGGILCAILTGRPPYVAGGNEELHAMAMRGDLADTHARLDACGADAPLILLAKRCLAADRDDRPGDAGELERALTGYLESVLKQPERDLVRFFELSLDLFCTAGLDGFFRRVNPNFSRVLGYPREELLARPFLDFVHPADREATVAAMARLSRGLPVVRFRNRYRDTGGGYRWFEWTAKSIPEEGVIFAVARDVTDRIGPEDRPVPSA
jgi:serine/threonine-protein kinase